MKQFVITVLLFVSYSCAQAAFSHPSTEPGLAACGETLASRDFAAATMLHTPAAICFLHNTEVELSGQRLYSLPELDSYLAVAAFKRGRWGMGLAFQSMGESDFYMETTFTGCLGYRIAEYLYAGASVGHSRVAMGDQYHSASAPTFGCGAILVPSPDWMAYASIRNPAEPEIIGGTKLHRELNAGIAVTRFENVGFAVEIMSRSGDDLRYSIGEVYRLSPALSVSAGIMTSPFVPSFGCRFTWKQFDLLYAYRYHPELGGTHIWGIDLSR
jgi:hypothetical protein